MAPKTMLPKPKEHAEVSTFHSFPRKIRSSNVPTSEVETSQPALPSPKIRRSNRISGKRPRAEIASESSDEIQILNEEEVVAIEPSYVNPQPSYEQKNLGKNSTVDGNSSRDGLGKGESREGGSSKGEPPLASMFRSVSGKRIKHPATKKSKKTPTSIASLSAELEEIPELGTLRPLVRNKRDEQNSSFYSRKIIPCHYFLALPANLKPVLEFQKWENLFSNCHNIYKPLVVEFYGNLQFPETKGELVCASWVRNKKILLNSELLGLILGVPSEGFSEYPKGTWATPYPASIICPELSGIPESTHTPNWAECSADFAIFKDIVKELVPKQEGRASPLSSVEATLVFLLNKSIPISLPFIVLNHMKKVVESNSHSLPFSGWLTDVFKAFEVPLPDQHTKQLPFTKMKPANVAPGPSSSSSSASLATVMEQITALIDKMDSLSIKVEMLQKQEDAHGATLREIRNILKGSDAGHSSERTQSDAAEAEAASS